MEKYPPMSDELRATLAEIEKPPKADLSEVCEHPLVEMLYEIKTRALAYKYPKYAIPFLGAVPVIKQHILDDYEERQDAYYKHRESHVYQEKTPE